jgi:hypothetical protein
MRQTRWGPLLLLRVLPPFGIVAVLVPAQHSWVLPAWSCIAGSVPARPAIPPAVLCVSPHMPQPPSLPLPLPLYAAHACLPASASLPCRPELRRL